MHALGESDLLPAGERSLARDRAEVLIGGYEVQLSGIWSPGVAPGGVAEFARDAREALIRSQEA